MTHLALPAPTLTTARLRLRPFGDADADDLFALHSNAYVLRYWDAPPWSDRGRAGRFIAVDGGESAVGRPIRALETAIPEDRNDTP